MNDIEFKIIKAIKSAPMATQQELADTLNMSRESVAGYIMRLTRRGAILGKGYILPTQNNILVIGGANVDLTGNSTQSFRPGDSNPGQVGQSAGGVGRNIAENLARLGNEVSIISIIGNDYRGRYLLEHAREIGLGTEDVIQHPDFATSTYLAMNNEKGELIGSIADMTIIDQLTPSMLEDKLSRIQAATTIVVEANLPKATLSWLSEQRINAPIVADAVSATKAPRLIPLLPRIDVLKVNKAEALAILEREENDATPAETLLEELLQKGVKTVLLSLSEQGVLYGEGDQKIHQTVPQCQMISDTGAGDSLLAGYVHSQRLSEEKQQRLRFAIACAAATLESKDAVSKTMTQTNVLKRFGDFINLNTETVQSELEK
ncbi:winged helix-turn-helix transcriptional regulator [Reinekea marina]|uniref:Carbohydrate kinase n=1 Tax=Reinekea marina TaxID=1310421 RepID=A0ABV7WWF7_9GAMM|nr:carbohydrate kinase [Reinekea marina]MDN3650230.1 winged helix-turn-helix transcriptional regulator [Reinekea marina]